MTPFQKVLYNGIVENLALDHKNRCWFWSTDYQRLPLLKLEQMALSEAVLANEQTGFYLDEEHPSVHLTTETLEKVVADALAKAYRDMGFTSSKSYRLIPKPPVIR